jgi:Zn-dependent peptidase ImmA (M78 family)/DNA-binding XRE family transcriptional regulator
MSVDFDGQKLRLIRLFAGQSLEDVGQSVDATRQYVHQLENGAKTPTEEMVSALADLFGVLPHFFETPLTNTVNPEQCHFRKQLTTPAMLTHQVLARGTLLDEFVSELAEAAKLPRVDFPDAAAALPEEIERAAEKCRQHWRLGLGGPITSMMRVVENAGAVVTHFGALSARVDALSMSRPRPIIVLNSAKESACRLRFDLAHECGHLVMHQGLQTGDRATEEQANRFASAFLLPRAAFMREFPRGPLLRWAALFQLKLRWKVSVRAIVRRAYDLQLIDAAKYRKANIYLVKTGQSKQEEYDSQIPIETPELLERALTYLENEDPPGLFTLASKLGLAGQAYEKLTGRKLAMELPKDGSVVMLGNRTGRSRPPRS